MVNYFKKCYSEFEDSLAVPKSVYGGAKGKSRETREQAKQVIVISDSRAMVRLFLPKLDSEQGHGLQRHLEQI